MATLLAQFTNLPSLLLLGSSGFSALLGERAESAAILSVLGLNGAIGFRVERQNEKVLAAWRQQDVGRHQVIRGGSLATIPASELVVGDVLLCHAGDVVPADARVLEADRLACDESVLSGESEPREKTPDAVPPDAGLPDRTCMLFAGTTIVTGRGRAVVTATGLASARGALQQSLESVGSEATPLEKRMAELSDRLSWGGLAAAAGGALVGALRATPPAALVRNAVALGVAAIPEGLPVVTTAALVRAMRKLRKRGLTVRRLASAETFGGVDVICMDKTGTLTENDMRLERLRLGKRDVPAAELRADAARELEDRQTLALLAGVLNSDFDLLENGNGLELSGSSTEKALVRAASAAGLDVAGARRRYPRRALLERRPGRDYVVSVHDAPSGGRVAFVKGAPEQVARLCAREQGEPLSPARRASILRDGAGLARQGRRVLAVGWKRLPDGSAAVPRGGFTFLGLAALLDPLRPNAADAVKTAHAAGIRTVLLTGDHRRTAEAIGRAVGLTGTVVDGSEAVRELLAGRPGRLERVSVFSRVTPSDKLAIVRRLRERGHVVAMAGDGINDAPALKAAHVGVAIGAGSSDLARQAADVVLDGGDLRSLLSAVGQGRVVQDDLRRALRFLLATNASEILLVVAGALAGAAPLTPMQLLWINLVSDTLPALALALQSKQESLLDRKATSPDAPLVSPEVLRRVLRDAVLMAALGGVGYLVGGRPAAFSTLIGAQLGYVSACRAPGARAGRRFRVFWAASLAVQALAMWLRPIRRALGLPLAPSPLELLGFGAGLLLPWLRSATDHVIVRYGPGFLREVPSTTLARALAS